MYKIGAGNIGLDQIKKILNKNQKIELSKGQIKIIKNSRKFLENKINSSDDPIYGVNTGFGSLQNIKINHNQLDKLQENLIVSHACGVGDKIPNNVVRIMLLLKIISLSKGYSGISLKTIKRLIFFYNKNILPVIYSYGSLGASGDLAPLAHLSLPIIGKGKVFYNGKISQSSSILKRFNIKPIKLLPKEGLALLNGTQFMSAYATSLIFESHKISYLADLISCVSLEAFDCRYDPFDDIINKVRNHKGQSIVSKRIKNFSKGSKIKTSKKSHLQDPYSFRCIPQVHGATLDTILYASKVLTDEINSVTDNPIISLKDNKIISGGNFHGQPLAYILDFLKISLAELGNISERRIFNLISGQRNLPSFLTVDSGLNSGFMIPQYTAASIVSINKQFANPASTDSITSSNGQEDHVSMGANSALQLYKIIENVKYILAIEMFTAAQALDFRESIKSSITIQKLIKSYRTKVKFIKKDEIMHDHIISSLNFIDNLDYE